MTTYGNPVQDAAALALRTAKTHARGRHVYCGEPLRPRDRTRNGLRLILVSTCGYPFDDRGVCVNRDAHADPSSCIGKPTNVRHRAW